LPKNHLIPLKWRRENPIIGVSAVKVRNISIISIFKPRQAPRRRMFPVFWGMSGSYKAMRIFDLNQKKGCFSIKN